MLTHTWRPGYGSKGELQAAQLPPSRLSTAHTTRQPRTPTPPIHNDTAHSQSGERLVGRFEDYSVLEGSVMVVVVGTRVVSPHLDRLVELPSGVGRHRRIHGWFLISPRFMRLVGSLTNSRVIRSRASSATPFGNWMSTRDIRR